MSREEVDRRWNELVGSRHLFTWEEVVVLQSLYDGGEVSRNTIYQMYLTSRWWRALRRKALKRDGDACVKCGAVNHLHVDHLRYRGMGKERLEDVQTLCWNCHQGKSKRWDIYANRKTPSTPVAVEGQLFGVLRRRERDARAGAKA